MENGWFRFLENLQYGTINSDAPLLRKEEKIESLSSLAIL
jgi:hypothetical protein